MCYKTSGCQHRGLVFQNSICTLQFRKMEKNKIGWLPHCDIYVLICDLNHASISVTFSLEQRQDLYDRPIQQPNVHLRNYTPSKNEIDNRSYVYKNAQNVLTSSQL